MNLLSFLKVISVMSLVLLCSQRVHAEDSAKPGFSMGNGTDNWIDVAGVTRNNSVLTE